MFFGSDLRGMTLPDAVRTVLDDEPVLDRLALGGEDALFVTPARLVRYRADGLFSDESAEEFPHDAERVSVSRGRRTVEISIEYVDDERSLSVPVDRFEAALQALLAGVLSATGVTADAETIIEAFRFDELTVVVTDRRLIEHVGTAVWNGEYEELRFEEVTGIDVERGRVATGIVLSADGRRKRIKIRNDRARPFETCVRAAIREHHGVGSLDELADEEEGTDVDETSPIARSVEDPPADGPKRPSLDPGEIDGPNADADRRPTGSNRRIATELETLANAIEEQETQLARQRRAIDRLRDELAVTPDRDR